MSPRLIIHCTYLSYHHHYVQHLWFVARFIEELAMSSIEDSDDILYYMWLAAAYAALAAVSIRSPNKSGDIGWERLQWNASTWVFVQVWIRKKLATYSEFGLDCDLSVFETLAQSTRQVLEVR